MVPLEVRSYYSLLQAVGSVEQRVQKAKELGFQMLALTDVESVAGAVRFVEATTKFNLKALLGATLWRQGERVVALADGPEGFSALCRILSSPMELKEIFQEKHLRLLLGDRRGTLSRLLLHNEQNAAKEYVQTLQGSAPLYFKVQRDFYPGNRLLEHRLEALGQALNIPLLASQPVFYNEPAEFMGFDVALCIRLKIAIETPHPEREMNDEHHFWSSEKWAEVFSDRPEWLRENERLAQSLRPALSLNQSRFPKVKDAAYQLRKEVYAGAKQRYGNISKKLQERLEHELSVIMTLGYADYFLAVYDVARYARQSGIRMAGRGSAVDSVVVYCLGLSEVDAFARNLLFERFMSPERAERPDIDLDLDARYRDQVATYVESRFGKEYVAGLATYSTYRARSAIYDVGRVLGFARSELQRIAQVMPNLPADHIEKAWASFPELRNLETSLQKRLPLLLCICAYLADHPRHRGTHLAGVLISGEPLLNVTPLVMAKKGVVISTFAKEDVEKLGFIKLDLLSLRTLSVVEDTLKTAKVQETSIPPEDPMTYARIRTGQTIGMFQLESPAQRSLQVRLGAKTEEDILHSLALIRPGPIKGNMVDPYLRRRMWQEKVSMHALLQPILAKSQGVVLFQEQVIEIAVAVAGFTPGEADRLRRVMTHARSQSEMDILGQLFVERAVMRGLIETEAQEIFKMLAGYASYGFCEAHAAAFAQTAYQTAYLSTHKAAHFFAAMLNHQPMGYYPQASLVREAKRRGLSFLPLDIRYSDRKHTVEDESIRVGFTQVHGFSDPLAERLLAERQKSPFLSADDVFQRSRLPRDVMTQLILAGALDGFTSNRRQLLFHFDQGEGLFGYMEMSDFPERIRKVKEFQALGIEVTTSLFAYLRPQLQKKGVLPLKLAKIRLEGEKLTVAGWPLRPHRPPTRSGKTVVFLSLEDEEELLDVVVREEVYQREGGVLFGKTRPLMIKGRLKRQGTGISLIADHLQAF